MYIYIYICTPGGVPDLDPGRPRPAERRELALGKGHLIIDMINLSSNNINDSINKYSDNKNCQLILYIGTTWGLALMGSAKIYPYTPII